MEKYVYTYTSSYHGNCLLIFIWNDYSNSVQLFCHIGPWPLNSSMKTAVKSADNLHEQQMGNHNLKMTSNGALNGGLDSRSFPGWFSISSYFAIKIVHGKSSYFFSSADFSGFLNGKILQNEHPVNMIVQMPWSIASLDLRWLFIVFFVQICIQDSGCSVHRLIPEFPHQPSNIVTKMYWTNGWGGSMTRLKHEW